ncbi:MAG: GYD domain-containing protein [Planctomycetota bacterium]|nr:GYD domain-containing protein [Planctomycetota bacterium]
MAIFIRLAKMTEHGVRRIQDLDRVMGEVKEIAEAEKVKIVNMYATMGEYDFVAILEAPDDKAMMKFSGRVGAKGNFNAVTMAALPIAEFKALFDVK